MSSYNFEQHADFAALCFELSDDVPDWVEVLPPGPSVQGRDGRTWSYEPTAVMAATLAHGVDLPFDYLHATELKAPQGDDAPAAGWVREYRLNERGAMEARVDWTERARNAIAAREYRYVSPVFLFDQAGRIHRFSSFGLVNKPNLAIRALNAEQPQSLHGQSVSDGTALNSEQMTAARMFGLSAAEYLELIREAPPAPVLSHPQPKAASALNSEQQDAARMFGLSDAEYLKLIQEAN